MLRYTRCNIEILMTATTWLLLSFSFCIVCGFDSYTVLFKCPQRKFLWGHLKSTVYKSNPHTIQKLKDIISHAVAAIKITVLHPVYLNMVTALLFTNCSNAPRNIHTNATENITRTRVKRKGGYFFVAHPVYVFSLLNAGLLLWQLQGCHRGVQVSSILQFYSVTSGKLLPRLRSSSAAISPITRH